MHAQPQRTTKDATTVEMRDILQETALKKGSKQIECDSFGTDELMSNEHLYHDLFFYNIEINGLCLNEWGYMEHGLKHKKN